MREYQPFVLSALEAPRCPACHASRMIPSEVGGGPTIPGQRTFECQKCGHVRKPVVSEDPVDRRLRGWLNSSLRPPI
jgi:hypothetical protein